jgi:hypothetical protein
MELEQLALVGGAQMTEAQLDVAPRNSVLAALEVS